MEELYTFDEAYQRLLGLDIDGVEIAGYKSPGVEERHSHERYPGLIW